MQKLLIVLSAVAVVAAGGAFVLLRPEPISRELPFTTSVASSADLATVAKSRVYFAHQSVGQNILDVLATIFSNKNSTPPAVTNNAAETPSAGGFVLHTEIGTNGDPIGKIQLFDKAMRSGLAAKIDIAILKLCFVDFNAGSDVAPIFSAYNSTMAALERDFPSVTFIYTTVPLMADRDLYLRLKALLGKGNEYDPSHNAARERYNALIRAEYGASGRLFDVAAVEAVGTGDKLQYHYSPAGEFLAMDPRLSSDGGHLNAVGASLVANEWLTVVARAAAQK